MIASLEQLPGDAVVVSIDEYGDGPDRSDVGTLDALFLQVANGRDRVLWTCPSGRTFEWTWDERDDAGRPRRADRGARRRAHDVLRRRRVAVALVVDGHSVAVAEGRLRLAALRRLALRLTERDDPAG